jgi:hypothetical protein
MTIPGTAETVSEEPIEEVSRKRKITAAVVATVVSVGLGLVATGAIDKVATTVKNKIAPPEKDDE